MKLLLIKISIALQIICIILWIIDKFALYPDTFNFWIWAFYYWGAMLSCWVWIYFIAQLLNNIKRRSAILGLILWCLTIAGILFLGFVASIAGLLQKPNRVYNDEKYIVTTHTRFLGSVVYIYKKDGIINHQVASLPKIWLADIGEDKWIYYDKLGLFVIKGNNKGVLSNEEIKTFRTLVVDSAMYNSHKKAVQKLGKQLVKEEPRYIVEFDVISDSTKISHHVRYDTGKMQLETFPDFERFASGTNVKKLSSQANNSIIAIIQTLGTQPISQNIISEDLFISLQINGRDMTDYELEPTEESTKLVRELMKLLI